MIKKIQAFRNALSDLNAALAESKRLLAEATETIHRYEADHVAGQSLRERLRKELAIVQVRPR